jgi:hypothetical protein
VRGKGKERNKRWRYDYRKLFKHFYYK